MRPGETITNRFGTFEAIEMTHGCSGCVAILPQSLRNTHHGLLCEYLPCIHRGHHTVIFKEVKSKDQ